MNLLKETSALMKKEGLTRMDITFIGSACGEYYCSVKDFERMANFDYDAGFGAAHVVVDLVICFSNGVQFIRDEYDGSESWGVVRPVQMNPCAQPLLSVGDPRFLWVHCADVAEKLGDLDEFPY